MAASSTHPSHSRRPHILLPRCRLAVLCARFLSPFRSSAFQGKIECAAERPTTKTTRLHPTLDIIDAHQELRQGGVLLATKFGQARFSETSIHVQPRGGRAVVTIPANIQTPGRQKHLFSVPRCKATPQQRNLRRALPCPSQCSPRRVRWVRR